MLLVSLPARGAWIEIAEYGEDVGEIMSLPARGAWIEISYKLRFIQCHHRSLPARGAWIEIPFNALNREFVWSLPARGAWIEMCPPLTKNTPLVVAPRTGSVD